MGGLLVRPRTVLGQRIEISLYCGLISYVATSFESEQQRLGLMSDRGPGQPEAGDYLTLNYLVARCKDGQWLQLTNDTARLFPMFIAAIGLGPIFQVERFRSAPFSFAEDRHREEL